MLMNQLRRFIARMSQPRATASSDRPTSAVTTTSTFDVNLFDPTWHGDHWQNLLSSPMDARHYVMEDWSVTVDQESSAEYRVAPAS